MAVVHRCPLFRGFSIKIAIKFHLAGLRRPLLAGGRCSEVAVNTGLTVHRKSHCFRKSLRYQAAYVPLVENNCCEYNIPCLRYLHYGWLVFV